MGSFNQTSVTAEAVKEMAPPSGSGISVKTVKVALGVTSTAAAGAAGWVNPEGTKILVRQVDTVFLTGGTGTIDVGVSTAGTGAATDIINGGTLSNVAKAVSGVTVNAGGTAGTIGVAYGWILGASGDAATNSIVAQMTDTPTSTAVGFLLIQYNVIG
jgi:hypothetical protein